MVFFSLNYSYRTMEQAEGRIDRLNTPYSRLNYYRLMTDSPIDKAILAAIYRKKKFNERAFVDAL
jgi:NAD-dependent DNA ligase (contains BRCT domain type II)